MNRSILLFILTFSLVKASDELPCSSYQSVNITGAIITPNGSAIYEGQEYLNGTYGYYKDSIFENLASNISNIDERVHLRGCVCLLKGAKPCLNVCCPPGYLKRDDYRSPCYAYNFEVFVNTSNGQDRKEIKAKDEYTIVQSDSCNRSFHTTSQHKWKLLKNGVIEAESYEHNAYSHRKGNYCIDSTLMEDLSIISKIKLCYEFDTSYNHLIFREELNFELYGIISSIIFLMLTLLIYILVPDFQNLRGKLLMCYMTAVVGLYSFLAFDKVDFFEESSFACAFVRMLSYGFALLAIFFLNGINIDYFTTFYLKNFRKENKSKLFRWYVMYSIGGTLLFTFIAAILDATVTVAEEYIYIKRSFGSNLCYVNGNAASWKLFYVIVFVTILANIILLLMTTCKMRRIMKARTMVKDDRRKYNHDFERETFCHLFLMFLMIDFVWLAEMCFWIFDVRSYSPNVYQFIGYSQGLWIFLFCILKGSSFEKISKRWAQRRMENANLDGGRINYLRTESNYSERPATEN